MLRHKGQPFTVRVIFSKGILLAENLKMLLWLFVRDYRDLVE